MQLCEYGCGQPAKIKLRYGKMCCSERYYDCPAYRKKLQTPNRKFNMEEIREKHPLLFENEDVIPADEDKQGYASIMVHCHYSKCENSKENERWFIPMLKDLYTRCESLESKTGSGKGRCYFYCSQECKDKCNDYNNCQDSIPENDLANLVKEVMPSSDIKLQYPQLCDGRSRAYKIDIAICDIPLAIEYDGIEHHGLNAAYHDFERQSLLEEMGWVFLRYKGYVPERDELEGDIKQILSRGISISKKICNSKKFVLKNSWPLF